MIYKVHWIVDGLAEIEAKTKEEAEKILQEELDEITAQKVRLEDAFNAQLKHLEDREKEVKKELKVLSASKDK